MDEDMEEGMGAAAWLVIFLAIGVVIFLGGSCAGAAVMVGG